MGGIGAIVASHAGRGEYQVQSLQMRKAKFTAVAVIAVRTEPRSTKGAQTIPVLGHKAINEGLVWATLWGQVVMRLTTGKGLYGVDIQYILLGSFGKNFHDLGEGRTLLRVQKD